MSATGTSNEILSVLSNDKDSSQELELSTDEKKYLRQVGTIKVGYITDFAPFSYKQNRSIGAVVAGAGYPAENALKAADKNLYQVKENGKNNCLVTDVEEALS